jgi:hypothetical protein
MSAEIIALWTGSLACRSLTIRTNSKKSDIVANRLASRAYLAITAFRPDDCGQVGTINSMHEGFTRI